MRAWFELVDDAKLFISVLVLGELRQGIERKRRSDPAAARDLERWLAALVESYRERVLVVDDRVADQWGRLNVPDPLPTVDGLMAATALAYGLTVVTRNEADYGRTGVEVVNPFMRRRKA